MGTIHLLKLSTTAQAWGKRQFLLCVQLHILQPHSASAPGRFRSRALPLQSASAPERFQLVGSASFNSSAPSALPILPRFLQTFLSKDDPLMTNLDQKCIFISKRDDIVRIESVCVHVYLRVCVCLCTHCVLHFLFPKASNTLFLFYKHALF